jgi:hypothetical protein
MTMSSEVLAIQGLSQMDSAQGCAAAREDFLQGNQCDRLKERALFGVRAQSNSRAGARQVLGRWRDGAAPMLGSAAQGASVFGPLNGKRRQSEFVSDVYGSTLRTSRPSNGRFFARS